MSRLGVQLGRSELQSIPFIVSMNSSYKDGRNGLPESFTCNPVVQPRLIVMLCCCNRCDQEVYTAIASCNQT